MCGLLPRLDMIETVLTMAVAILLVLMGIFIVLCLILYEVKEGVKRGQRGSMEAKEYGEKEMLGVDFEKEFKGQGSNIVEWKPPEEEEDIAFRETINKING